MAASLDTLGILRRLVDAGVDFVLIGGSAAIAHGSAVTTGDVDICASLDHENAVRIIRAFHGAHPRWSRCSFETCGAASSTSTR